MHQQAQLRLRKEEVEKAGAEAYVVLSMDLYRTTAFKEQNLLLSTFNNPFAKEKSIVYAAALSDPSGSAAALYGVSRKTVRWGGWIENVPTWFVIDRKGVLVYATHPTFSTPTSYMKDIDLLLEALKKAGQE